MNTSDLSKLIDDIDDLSEAYAVVSTVHVVYKGRIAKFEVYQNPKGDQDYDVFAYRCVDDVWMRWTDFPDSYSDSEERSQ